MYSFSEQALGSLQPAQSVTLALRLEPFYSYHPTPPPSTTTNDTGSEDAGQSKVNRRDVFLDTSTFKNRKARRFINRTFENIQYFCLTKTSVAQMSIWNTECFRLSLRRCVGWWLSVDLAPEEVNPTPWPVGSAISQWSARLAIITCWRPKPVS